MITRRLNARARTLSRLVVFFLGAALPATCAFAQQSSANGAQFRDARLFSILADDDSSQASQKLQGPVKPAVSNERQGDESSKIRQVSASTRLAKPVAAVPLPSKSGSKAKNSNVAQIQYAEAATAEATSQGIGVVDMDGPFQDVCPDPREISSILDVPYKVIIPADNVPQSCPLPDEPFARKAPTPITFTWKASSLCYKPLYFEDVQLERYGHYCNPYLQPFVSRARFLLTVPCLPYLMGVDPPNQCVYDLGYYRPGNCAPSMLEPIPISLRGGLLQAGAVVGLAAAIP